MADDYCTPSTGALKSLVCAWCGEGFVWNRKKKYCSGRCGQLATFDREKKRAHQSGERRSADQVRKAHYEKAKLEGRVFNCLNCGKEKWQKRTSGGQKRSKYSPKFCSVPCRSDWRKKQNQKNDPAYIEQQERSRLIKRIGFVLSHHRRNMEYVEQRIEERHRLCGDCGLDYCDWPLFRMGRGSSRCQPCQDEVNRLNKKARRIERKAKEKGAKGYVFNLFDVFQRDGWRCQLCDCSSPKILRGTYHPLAPELDHIKPLSKGGEHTMENTQLLCRTCNMMKSDKSMTWAKRQLRSRDLRSLKLF